MPSQQDSKGEHSSQEIDHKLASEILKVLPSMVLVADATGAVIYASPSCKPIMGYEPGELLGEGYWNLPSPNPVARLQNRLAICRGARGEIPISEVPTIANILTKSGRPIWIYWRVAKGPGNTLVVSGQDITSLRKTEQLLASREAEIVAIFEAAGEAMMILDSDLRYVDANPAACELLGVPREEMVGRHPGQVNQCDSDVKDLVQKIKAGGPVTGHTTFTRRDGRVITAEYLTTPNFRPGHHLVTLRDITERRRLEQQVAQSSRLESIGRLAGGVAHEFNNMLTAIRGYAELLRNKLGPEDPGGKYLEGIIAASDRAAQTTQQLLAFSRRQVLQPQLLEINDAIASTLELLNRLCGDDVELVTKFEPTAGRVRVDPGQLGQVLVSLVLNARDALPAGGRVIIETQNATLDASYVSRHIQVTPGDYVLISISDTGVGMDAEMLRHLFEPFYTTKEVGAGSGLGLAMVYGIVKQSGGYIWVYSEVGEGTTFKIYFPKASDEVEQAQATHIRARSKTVLVIEDDTATRQAIAQALSENGFFILQAADGGEALSVCENSQSKIDLVLTDLQAPGMSGEDLIPYCVLKHPEAKILRMSGFTEESMVHARTLSPGVPFLQKPFTIAQLLAAVEQMLPPEPTASSAYDGQ